MIVFAMLIFLDIVGMMDSIYNLFTVLLTPEFYDKRLESNSSRNTQNPCTYKYKLLFILNITSITSVHTKETINCLILLA